MGSLGRFPVPRRCAGLIIACLIAWGMAPCLRLTGSDESAMEATQKVRQLLQQGDVAAARSALAEALRQFPHDASLHNVQGVMEAQQGDYQAAQASFRQALGEAPRYTGAYLNLGRLYQENAARDPAAPQKALETYQALLRFEPGNVEANYQMAVLLFQQGSFQASLDRLARLPAADQDHPQALSVRCGDYAGLGPSARAAALADRLLASPDLAEADVLPLLPVLAAHRQAGLAVKLLEGLEARNLASYESLCALGLLYREQGRPAPARAALEKAAQLKPDAASPLLDLARVAYDQQDYTAALGYLAHARDLEPQNGAIHFLWGLICMQQNLLEESYRALKLAASLDPENPAYNYAVGVVTMQRQDAREAIAYLQKYCALRPRDPAGRLALGVAYFNSNDLDKARELLAQVAGQPQTAAAANYYLARIAADEGDYTTAARDLQNSLKADPHYAEAYAELGHIQLKQRRYREARETLQKALDLNPESYSANLNLLDLYQKTKDPLAEAQAKRFDDVKQHRNEVAKEYLRKIEVRP